MVKHYLKLLPSKPPSNPKNIKEEKVSPWHKEIIPVKKIQRKRQCTINKLFSKRLKMCYWCRGELTIEVQVTMGYKPRLLEQQPFCTGSNHRKYRRTEQGVTKFMFVAALLSDKNSEDTTKHHLLHCDTVHKGPIEQFEPRIIARYVTFCLLINVTWVGWGAGGGGSKHSTMNLFIIFYSFERTRYAEATRDILALRVSSCRQINSFSFPIVMKPIL